MKSIIKRGITYQLEETKKPCIYDSDDIIFENHTLLAYVVYNGCYATYAIWNKKSKRNIYYCATKKELKKELKVLS